MGWVISIFTLLFILGMLLAFMQHPLLLSSGRSMGFVVLCTVAYAIFTLLPVVVKRGNDFGRRAVVSVLAFVIFMMFPPLLMGFIIFDVGLRKDK